MAERARVGRRGEAIAAWYLRERGYLIQERNFRCPLGEIDLVALKDDQVVFVEVKTRSLARGYHPTLSVTEDKKQRVRRLGEYYMAHHLERALQPRFDVVAVTLRGEHRIATEPGAEPRRDEQVEHFINAF